MVRITQLLYGFPLDIGMLLFAFAASLAGYNFVKFHGPWADSGFRRRWFLLMALISFAVLPLAVVPFLAFRAVTQGVLISLGLLTVFYAQPIIGRNLRNRPRVKIYLVALCWTVLTVVVPVLESNRALSADVWALVLQRFLIVLVLLFIFEIVDLRQDDPKLKTVPQQIGVRPTQITGTLLLVLFLMLEWFRIEFSFPRVVSVTVMAAATGMCLWNATPNRSRWYTVFWVESLPLVWWWVMEALAG